MNNNHHINDPDDVNDLPPAVNKAGKGSPLVAGDDYFEAFANKMQARVEAFEELQQEAPLLSNIPKYNPFTVPAHYFDDLPHQVQERCLATKKTTGIVQWLLLALKPRFAVPALSFVCLALVANFYFNRTSIVPTVAEESTLDEQVQSIDEATIIDALTADAGTTSTSTATAEDDPIVDYLMDNNLDETTLNTEL